MSSHLYIGLLSGTSVDAVDCVLAQIDSGGAVIVDAHSYPFPVSLQEAVKTAATNPNLTLDQAATLDTQLGELFADAANALLQKTGKPASSINAIGSHGQTLRHNPLPPNAYTVQLGDPNVIAQRTGVTVVADFRRRDVAAGGHAAPLAPALHRALFAEPGRDIAVLNLGGIANLTLLHADGSVNGFDTGPANTLLDEWIGHHQKRDFDVNGDWAAAGEIQDGLLGHSLTDPYFAVAPPKSTGTDYFNPDWLQLKLAESDSTGCRPVDIQATLAEISARSVADALHVAMPNCKRLLVCGGGAFNADLLARLGRLTKLQVETTAAAHVAPEWVEGLLFAWLAQRCLAGRAGNLPSVTGAYESLVLGAIYQQADRPLKNLLPS